MKVNPFPWWLGFLLPVCLLCAWQLAIQLDWLPAALIAPPSVVFPRLIALAIDGSLFRHIGISAVRLIAGFILGSVSGALLGYWLGWKILPARLIEPTVLGLTPVPPLAWIPLLIILLGIGDTAKIALIAVGCFFAVYSPVAQATRQIDRRYIELARQWRKSSPVIFFRIMLPATMLALLGALRGAMALSWTLLLVSEIIASSSGLGWLLWDSRNFGRADDMLAALVTIAVLGGLSDHLLYRLGRVLTPWRSP